MTKYNKLYDNEYGLRTSKNEKGFGNERAKYYRTNK